MNRRPVSSPRVVLGLALMLVSLVSVSGRSDEKSPAVGPQTEKRFPPLVVPDGFVSTLFACDPLVEYPSVISIGPRPGTLLVAHDYVTGLGIKIVRRDEVRLIADTDGDGYADQTTVYAKGFNSIQGLAWYDGNVFVMHAPLLTSLRDTDGDGVADQRHDLLRGLGLEPEKNNSRLHCANGVVAGFDGWLYLSMGDNGTDVKRPEGDRLLFQQGGILRCRFDGSDLHVFSGGLRNIYDLALDDDLNVFVRDNENDGGDYMIRVYHSIHGADHGYPYHYRERRELALGPLADLGRGSSAGGVFYGETGFPKAYRGGLFFCEWGSSVVFYPRQPAGAGFAPMREQVFATGSPTDPYGFKPTDAVVGRDGALYISDWADGQRPRRGRARIYRIVPKGAPAAVSSNRSPAKESTIPELFGRLGSTSRLEREAAGAAVLRLPKDTWRKPMEELLRGGAMANRPERILARMHAVWLLAHTGGGAVDDLIRVAAGDPSVRVKVQAIRAIADLTDPVLVSDRIESHRGDVAVAERLARLGQRADSRVHREVIVALGRLRWTGLSAWLKSHTAKTLDAVRLHAGQQALRRVADWESTLELLELPSSHPARAMALRAVADRYEPVVVDWLIKQLESEGRVDRRREYAEWLTRVWRKPAAWKYWGYRPAPRPVNSQDWDKTKAIGQALGRVLTDKDRTVRVVTLTTMRRQGVPVPAEALADWLTTERDVAAVKVLLDAIGAEVTDGSTAALVGVVTESGYPESNRLAALAIVDQRWKGAAGSRLVALGKRLEQGAVLADLVVRLGRRDGVDSGGLLERGLGSSEGAVRAAAITALARRGSDRLAARLSRLLDDKFAGVRRASAEAAARLKVKSVAAELIKAAGDPDPGVRAASLQALVALGQPGSLKAARSALDDDVTLTAGLDYLGAFGEKSDLRRIRSLARTYRSTSVQVRVFGTLDRLESRKVVTGQPLAIARADLQGDGGLLLRWRATEVMTEKEATGLIKQVGSPGSEIETDVAGVVMAAGADPAVALPRAKVPDEKTVRVAWTDVSSTTNKEVEFLAAAGGRLRVEINGTEVYRRDGVRGFQPDSDRFHAKLNQGVNRLVAWVDWNRPSRLQVRFRDRTLKGVLETYAQRALKEKGDVVLGERIFRDIKRRGLCARCHRIGKTGARIGPDLTGVGRRFSRIHLIEAVLEPSRAIAPSYQTRVVVLESGRVLTGVRVSETPNELTLGDKEGKLHKIMKSEIEEKSVQKISTMPDGVDKRLTQQEFIDLIEFLVSQRSTR